MENQPREKLIIFTPYALPFYLQPKKADYKVKMLGLSKHSNGEIIPDTYDLGIVGEKKGITETIFIGRYYTHERALEIENFVKEFLEDESAAPVLIVPSE